MPLLLCTDFCPLRLASVSRDFAIKSPLKNQSLQEYQELKSIISGDRGAIEQSSNLAIGSQIHPWNQTKARNPDP
ncbi:MAG: hypothetical protein LH628_16830 [Microcoleus sp. CAN_BIN18]|nr:hypothetical protein [Microcoleus sp. CAN_BIN18]